MAEQHSLTFMLEVVTPQRLIISEEVEELMAPGYAPGMAHLTGKPGEEKKEGEAKATPELEKLAKEIEEQRK